MRTKTAYIWWVIGGAVVVFLYFLIFFPPFTTYEKMSPEEIESNRLKNKAFMEEIDKAAALYEQNSRGSN